MARIKSKPIQNLQAKTKAKKMDKISKNKTSTVKRPHRYRPGL